MGTGKYGSRGENKEGNWAVERVLETAIGHFSPSVRVKRNQNLCQLVNSKSASRELQIRVIQDLLLPYVKIDVESGTTHESA